MMDTAKGELIERRLEHENGEADTFYRSLPKPVRVGIEATGPMHWFERLLEELGHELWIGDSAKICASEVRKQKTDQRDALLILDLLLANRFPRIDRAYTGRVQKQQKGRARCPYTSRVQKRRAPNTCNREIEVTANGY
jgi:transposase